MVEVPARLSLKKAYTGDFLTESIRFTCLAHATYTLCGGGWCTYVVCVVAMVCGVV